jgi:hypothetical protein
MQADSFTSEWYNFIYGMLNDPMLPTIDVKASCTGELIGGKAFLLALRSLTLAITDRVRNQFHVILLTVYVKEIVASDSTIRGLCLLVFPQQYFL